MFITAAFVRAAFAPCDKKKGSGTEIKDGVGDQSHRVQVTISCSDELSGCLLRTCIGIRLANSIAVASAVRLATYCDVLVPSADAPAVCSGCINTLQPSALAPTFIQSYKKKCQFNVLQTTFVLSTVESFTFQTRSPKLKLACTLTCVCTISHFCTSKDPSDTIKKKMTEKM